MPFQWKTGQPPAHLVPRKVLVLGPDEFYDSDYQFMKGVLDEFTVRLEHFHVVLVGNAGEHYKLEDRQRVYYGIDRVVLRWCDYYKYTRVLLPEHRYASTEKRNKDLVEVLDGSAAHCLWFKDEEDRKSRRIYNDVVRGVVSRKMTKIVRV